LSRTSSEFRQRHGQHDSSKETGDCFRASMSVILDVPNGPHLPTNDGSEGGSWWFDWHYFLWDLGLAIHHSSTKGPIWKSYRWVASVRSKNYEGCTHAIVMDGHKVLFDPSPSRRYHAGWSLLGDDVVVGGYWLEVADARLLNGLSDFRKQFEEISAIPS
jgi:hypothetical protein